MSVREPRWLELSAETEFAVLTFPDGQTLSAATIVGTRINDPRTAESSPRHVSVTYVAGGVLSNTTVYDDVDAVSVMVANAHRAQAVAP